MLMMIACLHTRRIVSCSGACRSNAPTQEYESHLFLNLRKRGCSNIIHSRYPSVVFRSQIRRKVLPEVFPPGLPYCRSQRRRRKAKTQFARSRRVPPKFFPFHILFSFNAAHAARQLRYGKLARRQVLVGYPSSHSA